MVEYPTQTNNIDYRQILQSMKYFFKFFKLKIIEYNFVHEVCIMN